MQRETELQGSSLPFGSDPSVLNAFLDPRVEDQVICNAAKLAEMFARDELDAAWWRHGGFCSRPLRVLDGIAVASLASKSVLLAHQQPCPN